MARTIANAHPFYETERKRGQARIIFEHAMPYYNVVCHLFYRPVCSLSR
jgi:hypothetical protein